jgi:hypothetical protein
MSLAFAQAAAAQDRDGGYMGFSIGSFSYEEEDLGVMIVDDSASAYRIVGGYRFSDNFALEGGWGKTGDLETSFTEFIPGFGNLTFDMSGAYEVLTVRALGIVPFERVSLVGGLGYYDAQLDATVSVTGLGTFDAEDSDNGATLVGGLEFNLERIDIRAELEWFDTDDGIEAWDISVGMLFHF